MPLALILSLALAGDYAAAAERAQIANADLDYAKAATLWESAIESATSDEERLEAHLEAGIARRIVGDDTLARLHFLYVLKRQPFRRLTDEQPPRVRQFFDLIREEVQLSQPARPAEPATIAEPEEDNLDTAPTPVPAGPEDTPPVVGEFAPSGGDDGFGALGWTGVAAAGVGTVGLAAFSVAALAAEARFANPAEPTDARRIAKQRGQLSVAVALTSGAVGALGGALIAIEVAGD